MDEKAKKELFRKFLENRCSEEERAQILVLLQAEEIPPALEGLINEDAQGQLEKNRQPTPEISQKMLSNIRREIHTRDLHITTKTRKLSRYLWFAVAAFTGLLLLAGGYYFRHFPEGKIIYTTEHGKTQHILLPDSSEVTLNANSKLTYATASFTPSVREIWLEGEAYFNVQRKEEPVPFIVHTDNLQVEVLGTQFNVNTRKDKTQVVLSAGKVKLINSIRHNELIMAPGELVEVSQAVPEFTRKSVDPEVYIAWRNNKLIFDGTPLTEIIQILKENYGFEVIVNDAQVSEEMVFTGSITANDIDLLLTLLSESFHIGITKQGNIIRMGE